MGLSNEQPETITNVEVEVKTSFYERISPSPQTREASPLPGQNGDNSHGYMWGIMQPAV